MVSGLLWAQAEHCIAAWQLPGCRSQGSAGRATAHRAFVATILPRSLVVAPKVQNHRQAQTYLGFRLSGHGFGCWFVSGFSGMPGWHQTEQAVAVGVLKLKSSS